jgi:hypothetical protein
MYINIIKKIKSDIRNEQSSDADSLSDNYQLNPHEPR